MLKIFSLQNKKALPKTFIFISWSLNCILILIMEIVCLTIILLLIWYIINCKYINIIWYIIKPSPVDKNMLLAYGWKSLFITSLLLIEAKTETTQVSISTSTELWCPFIAGNLNPPEFTFGPTGTVAKVPCKTGSGLQFETLQGWVNYDTPVTEQVSNCKTNSIHWAIKGLCVISALGFVWFAKDMLDVAEMTDTRSHPSRRAIEEFARNRRIGEARSRIGLGASTAGTVAFCIAWGTDK